MRVTVRMPLARGGLSKLSTAVAGVGGRFVAFAESMDKGTATFKVQDVDQESLRKAIEPFIDEIVDLRET